MRPDIYGKIGNSGVSIARSTTSRSSTAASTCWMTPGIDDHQRPGADHPRLFFNTAIDQQMAKFENDNGREPTEDEAEKIREWTLKTVRGTVQGRYPQGRPGPEHLHLQHRVRAEDDGRHPGVLRP